MADERSWISTALFATLGLVAAFAVSAVAGFWDDEPAETGLRAFGRGETQPGDIRVEVLNGAGASGLARQATYRLRGDGFDVVFFGNANHFQHERSVVMDRVGDPDRARSVAAALGIDSVASVPDSSLMLEATVVLGDDWPPPPPDDRGLLERLRDLVGEGGDSAAADGPAGADTLETSG